MNARSSKHLPSIGFHPFSYSIELKPHRLLHFVIPDLGCAADKAPPSARAYPTAEGLEGLDTPRDYPPVTAR